MHEIDEKRLQSLALLQVFNKRQMHQLQLTIESTKREMAKIMVEAGIDKYQDKKGNLWLLLTYNGAAPDIRCLPRVSRMKQNPKIKLEAQKNVPQGV